MIAVGGHDARSLRAIGRRILVRWWRERFASRRARWRCSEMLWKITVALLSVWLIGWVVGKDGMWHVFLLCAIGVGFVQFVADLRAAQR